MSVPLPVFVKDPLPVMFSMTVALEPFALIVAPPALIVTGPDTVRLELPSNCSVPVVAASPRVRYPKFKFPPFRNSTVLPPSIFKAYVLWADVTWEVPPLETFAVQLTLVR